MILIVGGLGAGKKTYARDVLGYTEDEFFDAIELSFDADIDVTDELPAGADAAGELTADNASINDLRRCRILSGTPLETTNDYGSTGVAAATNPRRGETSLAQPHVDGAAGPSNVAAGLSRSASLSATRRVAIGAEDLARTMSEHAAAALLDGCDVVLLREVGCGIVPIDDNERAWRERAGRLGCLLAAQAEIVVRVTCGIGRVIKGELPAQASHGRDTSAVAPCTPRLRVTLIRHGATAGTENRRYSGAGTDELLSEEGIRQARLLAPDATVTRVFTSGLLRCDETARILFPNARIVRVLGLAEMDFGAFEGKSYEELKNDTAYQSWVESWCEAQCLGGESKASFTGRVCSAFADLAISRQREGADQLICVCHAGTIRALLSTLAEPVMPYFDIETDVLGAWTAIWDGAHLVDVKPQRDARLK